MSSLDTPIDAVVPHTEHERRATCAINLHQGEAGTSTGVNIAPGSDGPMRRTDPSGRQCHWILEVHLVDREREIGGFFEQLLTVRRPGVL